MKLSSKLEKKMNILKRKYSNLCPKVKVPHMSKWWHILNKAGWHTDYVNQKNMATMSKPES